MKRFRQTSIKTGQTSAARRVLAGATAITAAPSASSDGYLLEQSQWAQLLVQAGGTRPVFTLQIWLYSEVSQRWHASDVVTAYGDEVLTLEHRGFHRIYVQVTAVSGTSPTLNLWVARVEETP